MARLGLESDIVDQGVYDRTVQQFRSGGIRLPTFSELANPETICPTIQAGLRSVEPDEPHPLNLFRVHWYNDADRRGLASVPGYIVLPESVTGVRAPILVAIGSRFPMITAHKVLAAYGCLAPRVVTGQFDPTAHKAVWPSTGNYCRGGVAISRILGCRGVAVLPEGMSRERFDWLEHWVTDQSDIIRTVGTESNVKEIYDKCAELDATESNIIFNQFCEFGNHLVHLNCTGKALHHAFRDYAAQGHQNARLFAYISATGSAGTLAAGDYLKDETGSLTVAVEALECPTLLYNGFGEHNIQGIGDKHVPYIHNVSGTDAVAGITDVRTDSLGVLFNSEVGRRYLVDRRGVDPQDVANLKRLGLSGIGNVLAAIKTAKYYDLGPEDVLMTVATDDYDLYASEFDKVTQRDFAQGFDTISAAEVYGRGIMGLGTDHYQELTKIDRDRIFNLGYFTWVEQQGVSVEEFEARRHLSYWRDLRSLVPQWDELIDQFNAETGVSFA